MELKSTNSKNNNKVAELIGSDDILEKFIYSSSHDLQEPMRMILNFMDLLEESYRERRFDSETDQYMFFIKDAAFRMNEMIEALLTYSRVARDDNFQELSLEELIEDLISELGEEIKTTRAQILHQNLPRITAKKNEMEWLFRNLVSNAIKFSSKNNQPVIEISAEPLEHDSKALWKFKLKDNGIGIANEDQDQVFELFYKIHGKSEYPGSGLGLAIVKKIIRRYGGDIWIESKP
ncbi:MAG: ATP-binding protein, partial [Candidatus Melainabacteria bacterium]|nr:ATP-binding protein [Candidatus Melainabacteria bacterium]